MSGVVSEELSILESCCLIPIMRNSVLEELRVRRLASKKVSVTAAGLDIPVPVESSLLKLKVKAG